MRKIFTLILMLMPLITLAQRGPERGAEVDEIRRNVYSRVLILSSEESQKFWPVFNRMQGEIDAVQDQMMKERRNVYENYSSLSDAEIEKSINRMLDLEDKITGIKRRYITELKTAIPMKKIALMPKAEREFKKELLHRLKGDRRDVPPPMED